VRALKLSAPVRLGLVLAALIALSGPVAAAAGATVDVFPFPGSRYEMPDTQIAFRGIPASQIGTVTVVGSRSGTHAGTIKADSDGDGGSWVAKVPFDKGETVEVATSLDLTGDPDGHFSFKIAFIGSPFPSENLGLAPVGSDGIQHFRSAPNLTPATVKVTEHKAPASDGDIFVAPQFGPTQNGPMILNPSGQLVWFDPTTVKDNQLSTDFRVQTLYGKPVLTWFQGFTGNGFGRGVGMVYNQNYQLQQVVRAADGLTMDLHEFLITNTGDAYIIAVQPVYLPGVHRPISDSIVQEIDMQTGLVVWDWNALDHIPLQNSSFYGPHVSGHVLDPFHLNSVSVAPNGDLLISARNTSAVYMVNRDTGKTIWTLGGKQSTFKMGPGATFALQHDAEAQPNGTITVFDDGAGPPRVHSDSRAIDLALNATNNTATLVHQYHHSPPILADFEGSEQVLGDGNDFVGWGQQPYFTEFSASGAEIFDAHFVSPTSSYRAYRFPWSAQPPTTPAIAVRTGADGTITVYGSWNGATDVTGWRALVGDRSDALTALHTVPVHGFETGVPLQSGDTKYRLQALGDSGQVLSTTAVAGSPEHVAVYGHSAFVSSSGGGAVPVGCFAPGPCTIVTTASSGTTVLAHTGGEKIAANGTGLAYFQLSAAATAELAHDGSMSVTISIEDNVSQRSATVPIELYGFKTSGTGPKRSFSPKGPLTLLGGTEFITARGYGGILTSCDSAVPCVASATLTAAGTVIATTGSETVGPASAGNLGFTLNAAGQKLLADAPGHQLATTVTLSGAQGIASSATVALVPFG
jgi:hypothetical protein